MLASDNDCTQLAELLTKYGADLEALNKDSKTAFEIACHKGTKLILEINYINIQRPTPLFHTN